jgi:hypothetical protein
MGAPWQPAAPGEHEEFIEAAREAALAYSSRLPDFICTQTVKRSNGNPSGLTPLDTLSFETSYYRGQETSRLTHVNSAPAAEFAAWRGMTTKGEFGANLVKVFAPASEARFEFLKWTTLRGRRAAVYSYRVARAKAPYLMNTRDNGEAVSAIVGLRGEIVIDAASHSVLRIQYIADEIPSGFPVRAAETTVDYEEAEIGGQRYLLPSRAEGTARTNKTAAKNESLFRNYRKFSADSLIQFGDPAPAQR